MDWHLVGVSLQLLSTGKKRRHKALRCFLPRTVSSPSAVKLKMSKSLQRLQGLGAQDTSLVSALVGNIFDAREMLSTWLLDRLKGCKLHSV